VVHATIPSAFFAAHPSDARKDVDVAFAGRLLARKGLHVVLDAMSWLAQRGGRRVTLAVAGDGPERHALEERARMLNLVDQVAWLGPVDVPGVVHLLDRARLFAYPTLSSEAFGCSNLEAMARGTPVVTTNLGGTADYVCPEENALVCAPDSAESLAGAIDRLLDDPQLSARLRAAGIATARRFHPQEGRAQWRQAIDEVLRHRG
jgi:glycosyltransferase involved in cell wall biosynthesis